MSRKVKVNDLIIVTSLGEMKIYKAEPRTLEAKQKQGSRNMRSNLTLSLPKITSMHTKNCRISLQMKRDDSKAVSQRNTTLKRRSKNVSFKILPMTSMKRPLLQKEKSISPYQSILKMPSMPCLRPIQNQRSSRY